MPRTLFFILALLLLAPANTHAATKAAAPLEVSGWIPYWRMATGTVDVLPHLDTLHTVMPFGYVVQNDGGLYDAFEFSDTSATSTAAVLIAAAKAQKVKVVPTVMWSNSTMQNIILRSTPRRRELAANIAAEVKEHGFDGIDIDFESKPIKTRPYFSLFLEGLKWRLGNKILSCSIEARTPPTSVYEVLPDKIEYADDYVAINKYCDRVQIMTYDQGAGDRQLNSAANGQPYIPVSDIKWVEKVFTLAMKTISKNKLFIGVPTYGYEYEVTPLTQGFRYDINWALNPGYAKTLANDLHINPVRNSAGEMSFIYTPTTTPQLAGAAAAIVPPHIVWWSDAQAIADKVALAKKLGVRGVAVFKLDGGEDQGLWDVLPKRK